MKPVKLKLIGIISIFVIILITTIGYSALNTNLTISGEAHMRVSKELRISNVELLSLTNGAYETYGSDYSKNTTSMHVTLPNANSTATYKVTVINKTGNYFSPNEIVVQSNTNSNVTYELSGIESYNIYSGETLTFNVIFKTTKTNQKQDLVLEYNLKEITTTTWTFGYTGGEQTFNVPYNASYKIETWGAQGGYNPEYNTIYGYGGYSGGNINLKSLNTLYVNVGGQGANYSQTGVTSGGYNGGANGGTNGSTEGYTPQGGSGGGGATHVATKSGLLSTLSNSKDSILIVSGGGGGSAGRDWSLNGAEYNYATGGSGGGQSGGTGGSVSTWPEYYATGGTQTAGGNDNAEPGDAGTFGQGALPTTYSVFGGNGGGGGYYGGGGSSRAHSGAGGGSGYIGNSLLTNKVMYCYNCTESSEVSTKTISTTNISSSPISNYAKKGNGYAKITLLLEESSQEIEISNIELVSLTNGAYENENKGYSINSTSMNVTLPNTTSTAMYKITITNKTSNYFSPIEIAEKLNSNSNVKYAISGLSINNVYQGSEYTFNITLSTSVANQSTNLVLKYGFEKVPTTQWVYNYTGAEQSFTAPYPGTYNIELWGAQGGTYNTAQGGYGGYTKGNIELSKNTKLYVYVGSQATDINGGYNGGAIAGTVNYYMGGGGATDVRLVNGTWNNFDSLKSRIMVAGAGAGSGIFTDNLIGGAAGGLTGYGGTSGKCEGTTNSIISATGATQTSGGTGSSGYDPNPYASLYGQFGYATAIDRGYGTGGGSGYYGGGSAIDNACVVGSGGGGSSFVSGHSGCDAINASSTASSITHSGQSVHYSGYKFTNTIIVDGQGYNWTTAKGSYTGMPNHAGTSTITGNTGNGYAKITLIPRN